MYSELKKKIKPLQKICKNYNVDKLYAFGSVCTEQFSQDSDIDLLVIFKEMDVEDYADNYFLIVEEFEKLYNRKVDLVTDKSLSNPYFINSIEKTKTILYA